MTSCPAFTLVLVQKYSCPYNKKKITWWFEDMNFILVYAFIFSYSLCSFAKYCFCNHKIKFISMLPCNILYFLGCEKKTRMLVVELQVASCELQVAVASCSCELQLRVPVASCELHLLTRVCLPYNYLCFFAHSDVYFSSIS